MMRPPPLLGSWSQLSTGTAPGVDPVVHDHGGAAFLERGLQCAGMGREAPVETDHQARLAPGVTGALQSLFNFLNFGFLDAERLFDKDVLTSLQSRRGQGSVAVVDGWL